MKICSVLQEKNIIPKLKGKNKDEIINELVNTFCNDISEIDIEGIKKAVWEREQIMSTGIGKGIALPHAKSDSVKEIIAAFGKTDFPIEYNSLDNKPASLFFLFISNNNLAGDHLRLISRISKMMDKSEFRSKLLNSKTAEEIYSVFLDEETQLLKQMEK